MVAAATADAVAVKYKFAAGLLNQTKKAWMRRNDVAQFPTHLKVFSFVIRLLWGIRSGRHTGLLLLQKLAGRAVNGGKL